MTLYIGPFLHQEAKSNALSRSGIITANKFGEKNINLKNFACINFRESVNIEFFEFGQNSRNSLKVMLTKVSAPKVVLPGF